MFVAFRIDPEIQEECFRTRQYVRFERLMEIHPSRDAFRLGDSSAHARKSLPGDPSHTRRFHELLRRVVDVAPLATFGW